MAKRSNAEYLDYQSLRPKIRLAIEVGVLYSQEVVSILLELKLDSEKQPNRIHTSQPDYLSNCLFGIFFASF
ncbi:MAG TPA: hypothetical protein DDZ97_05855 [Deltaproteobacteria bacterium]|nr:hypothetical protein [Deltaproteobacteria bacterium]